jgi:hypothetical protein
MRPDIREPDANARVALSEVTDTALVIAVAAGDARPRS